jgi:site-specific DNA-methyltransferase (adenine-specific)
MFGRPGDVVLDPFCGSGTTCVSAKSLSRHFVGIDINPAAVRLAQQRLNEMVITNSRLLEVGKDEYQTKSEKELIFSIPLAPQLSSEMPVLMAF